MAHIDSTIVERIASALRNGDVEEARNLLTKHPEYRAFLDVGEALTGEYRDSINGSLQRIDSWSDYAEATGHRELASMVDCDLYDPVSRGIYDAIRLGRLAELRQLFRDHPRYIDGFQGGIGDWLRDAAHYGHVEIAKTLVAMGADVNARRFGTDTALNSAVGFAGPDMVEYLLSCGADTNDSRDRPLIGAINRDDEALALRLVELLVQHGADVNRVFCWFDDPNNTFTALEWAADKPKVAEYLRSKGAVERKKTFAASQPPANFTEEIIAYFEKHFGSPQPQAQIEIVPSGPPIAIHVIPAISDRKYVTLFTTGMSKEPMRVPDETDEFRFAELFIQLPADWPTERNALSDGQFAWPLHWLRSIAQYPHQNQTWLGGPVTIIANGDLPAPLSPGLKFTSLLVMADREFTSRDGRKVYLYRLTPLYTEERDLEIKQGIGALLRAFDENDIPSIVDLDRPNVAKEAR